MVWKDTKLLKALCVDMELEVLVRKCTNSNEMSELTHMLPMEETAAKTKFSKKNTELNKIIKKEYEIDMQKIASQTKISKKNAELSSLMVIPVPVPTHSTLMRNHHNVGLLQASLDLWDQADQMIFRTHSEDFFIQLDHEFGSLTLHSTLRELVRIVRAAVERLGNYNRDCAIGRDVNWP
ncbi:hypothetical protein QYM36_011148 [Artemia franciscana]|uniref:AF4/FMR2 family member lilli n=2 Tax=Artemia franciscana TaxID=6661 RepID=A0AA88HJA6_ARTSF|nr:hypothetical protein QYM36_011148 [Artemia franciscana]